MLRKMSWRTFLEWKAYAELEPFDETRADWRTASIVAAVLNSTRSAKSKAVPVKDALLLFGDAVAPKKPKQTWQQQKMIAQLYSAAFSRKPEPEVIEEIAPS